MSWRVRPAAVLAFVAALVAATAAQTPVPFPKPGQTSPPPPTRTPPPPTPAPATQTSRSDGPSEAELNGVILYPSAQFLASYDAGKGQRYYLYGTTASYVEIVAYYKTLLKKNGDQIFDPASAPGMHMFELARFREESMAFPPSVTVKDYSASGGYLNPKRGAQPARFPTIIQIVPAPAGASR